MSETITILGQKLKLVRPIEGQPYYERGGSESELWIQAFEPDPYFGYRTWRINVASLDGNLPLVEGSTLKEAEEALTVAIKKHETRTRAHLSKLNNLLEPRSASSLERGPDSVVVNGRTFFKKETKVYYKLLVEEYRTHNSFVLKRRVHADSPAVPLWHVCYGTTYEGHERGAPETALKDALESVRAQIKDVSDVLKKRQEVLKSLEDLEKDLTP